MNREQCSSARFSGLLRYVQSTHRESLGQIRTSVKNAARRSTRSSPPPGRPLTKCNSVARRNRSSSPPRANPAQLRPPVCRSGPLPRVDARLNSRGDSQFISPTAMRLVTYQSPTGPRVAGLRNGACIDLNHADKNVPHCIKMLLAQGRRACAGPPTPWPAASRSPPTSSSLCRSFPIPRRSFAWA